MMNKLILQVKPKKYPYDDGNDENWAEINFSLHNISSGNNKVLLKFEWNINSFVEWLRENKDALLENHPPFEIDHTKSIANSITEFYSTDKNIPDSLLDQVFSYRQSHGLRFAFRGSKIPDVYIGKRENHYEISRYDGEEKWSYKIDLSSFINETLS